MDATAGTLAAGAVNLLATGLAIPLIERLGRRTLVLTGIAGMGLSTCGLVAALLLKPAFPASTALLGYVAIVFVMLAVAFFEVGLGAIPWSIGGELFPAESKGAAMAFGAAVNWTATTLVGLLFPLMQKSLPNGLSFAPFAAWEVRVGQAVHLIFNVEKQCQGGIRVVLFDEFAHGDQVVAIALGADNREPGAHAVFLPLKRAMISARRAAHSSGE